MESHDEASVKRLERLARTLTFATIILAVSVVLLLILDFGP